MVVPDRSLLVVLVVSWVLMLGLGASLPDRYRVWFQWVFSACVGLLDLLGRLVQGLVGALPGDWPLVGVVGSVSSLVVGLVVGSFGLAVAAKPAAGWLFGVESDAADVDG